METVEDTEDVAVAELQFVYLTISLIRPHLGSVSK